MTSKEYLNQAYRLKIEHGHWRKFRWLFLCPEKEDIMPRKPKRPCQYPGCPELTDEQYCEKHKDIARQNYEKYQRRPDVHKKYGRAWKRIRDSYAAAHPLSRVTDEEMFTRLLYYGIGQLHLSQDEVWLMPFGLLFCLLIWILLKTTLPDLEKQKWRMKTMSKSLFMIIQKTFSPSFFQM